MGGGGGGGEAGGGGGGGGCEGGEGGEGGEVGAMGGGKDAAGGRYASVARFWEHCAAEAVGWYAVAGRRWQAESGDLSGMLGGLDEVHAADLAASLGFLDELFGKEMLSWGPPPGELGHGLPSGVALDVGAGIGRVSSDVLLLRFKQVELLEAQPRFLEVARGRLHAANVRAVHTCGLQDFRPPAGAAYAAVWVQWVLNYVTDADLVCFLRRAAASCEHSGLVVVKESVAREETGFFADISECSITRTERHFRSLFAEAGLEVVAARLQPGMPRGLFAVRMFALRPSRSAAA